MLNVHDEQFFKLQLKWAADNFDAEHRMRLAADERAAGARGLLMDVVVHLLASELDDVRKKEDVALWSDAQLVRWMKDQLGHHLMQLRFLTGYAVKQRLEQAAQEVRRLQAENTQLSQQNLLMQAEVKHASTEQATIADLRQQVERLQRELADCRDDLDTARRQAAQQVAPPIATTERPIASQPTPRPQPVAPSATPDWYIARQRDIAPEVLARQQRLIQVVGDGEAFFRAEIVATLNASGLLNDDPSATSWTAKRLFASVSELGLIEEINGGYGANIPKVLTLTEKGCVAYERLTGHALPRSPWARLLDRHKTIEHTVLNLLARNILHRFHYTAIDLFPEPRRTPAGALVIPDLTAISPDSELLLIECERLAKHRTAEERRNKWGDLATLTQGQFYVAVPGSQQQRDLITEISQWLIETNTKRAHLSICQYTHAIKPEATSPWTYTTDWAFA
jgi:hypothetical protein